MKRNLCLILSFLLIFLSGCHSRENGNAAFYYCLDPAQPQYFEADSIIQSESRPLPGHRDDLQYMVGLYLAGPMDEKLVSLFGKNTRLLSVSQEGGSIQVELSNQGRGLTDSEFTLACACLTLTCMAFLPCDEVTVVSGEKTITMDSQSMILSDILPQQETTGG